MKVIMNGAAGRMGREICRLIEESEGRLTLAAAVDVTGGDGILTSLDAYEGEADVIVDFSFHGAVRDVCAYAQRRGLPVVIATTGHTPEETAVIEETAKTVPVFFSANMSIGIAVLADLAKQTAARFPEADIEIVESHHNRKLDAPSGTALLLANAIKEVRTKARFVLGRSGHGKRDKNDIGIHAVRMGNVVGDHEIIIGTDTQMITLKHQAMSRTIFAEGAVAAALFMKDKAPGLYAMKDMID